MFILSLGLMFSRFIPSESTHIASTQQASNTCAAQSACSCCTATTPECLNRGIHTGIQGGLCSAQSCQRRIIVGLVGDFTDQLSMEDLIVTG